MLRIGLWAEALCAPPNGTRTLIAALVAELLRSGRYEITLVCPDTADLDRIRAEFDSPRLHCLMASGGAWSNRLAWLLGFNSLSALVGAQHVWLSGWHWPLGRRDVPFIAIVHDVRLLEASPSGPTGFARRAAWKWLTFVSLKVGMRRASSVVCVSEFTRDRLKHWFPGADGRIDVIHNGIDLDWWAAPPGGAGLDALRRRLGLPDGSDYILGLGAHSEQKNFPALIRAFARLEGGSAPPHLVIAGREAADTGRMRSTADTLGISGRVILAGGLADDEIRTLMHGARIFAFPSLYEGFGIPLLEAFAAGTPVVSSALAAIEEVAAGAAMLVDPNDDEAIAGALQSLWDDPAHRAGLARAGKARAASFDRAGTASLYRRLIDQVAAAGAVARTPITSSLRALPPSAVPPPP